MIDEHIEQLKEKMIVNSFIAEDRMYQMRVSSGAVIQDAATTEDFADVVREEVERIERTANVVTAVNVEPEKVDIAVLIGESADWELVERLLEDLQHRVHTAMDDRNAPNE